MQRTGRNGWKSQIIPIFLLFFVIIFDQLTKSYFHSFGSGVNNDYNKEIIKGFLSFTYTENSGAAFSFLNGKDWAQTFFKALTVCAIVVFYIYYLYAYPKYKLLSYSIMLIFGGMLGNFIDRIAFNYVVDFIACNFWGYQFAIFNIADSSLCIGVALLIFHYLFLDKEALFRKRNKNENK